MTILFLSIIGFAIFFALLYNFFNGNIERKWQVLNTPPNNAEKKSMDQIWKEAGEEVKRKKEEKKA